MTLARLDNLPTIEQHRGSDSTLLRDELLALITSAMHNRPRSLQRWIGPSDIGTPCTRKLGFKIADVPALRQSSSWLPEIGTAVHAYLAEVLAMNNSEIGFTRWLIEQSVCVGTVGGRDVTGSVDAYDRVTCTVVDWKVVGRGTLTKVRKGDVAQQYRTQVMLYAKGLKARGADVDNVAIAYIPRESSKLSDAHWHCEPYDEAIANVALARAELIATAIKSVGADALLPELPIVDDWCSSCSWFSPDATDLARACPGALPPARPAFAVA